MFLFVILTLTGFATLLTGLGIGAMSSTLKGRDTGASIAIVGLVILLVLFITA